MKRIETMSYKLSKSAPEEGFSGAGAVWLGKGEVGPRTHDRLDPVGHTEDVGMPVIIGDAIVGHVSVVKLRTRRKTLWQTKRWGALAGWVVSVRKCGRFERAVAARVEDRVALEGVAGFLRTRD